MAVTESPPRARPEAIVQTEASLSTGVTIKNDTPWNIIITLMNGFWGEVSQAWIPAGDSLLMAAVVNVDAYAYFPPNGPLPIQTWPGPTLWYSSYQINLTPGQTYDVSTFKPH
jgi:hypothetical protein